MAGDRGPRTLRFLISGGTGFAIYYVAALLLRHATSWPDGVCALGAMVVSIPPAFLLQKHFTFRHDGAAAPQLAGYVLLQAASALLIGAVAQLCAQAGLAHALGFFLGGVAGVAFSYVAQAVLIFRRGPEAGINAQYNVAKAGSLPVRLAAKQRRVMYSMFLEHFAPGPQDTVLDVGATSEQSYEASNYLESWYPHKAQVTACGVDDASFLERKYPGMRFVRADGRDLPFPDAAFDFVHSSAVLEHVGSNEAQAEFIRELRRVARKGVFLTTPNRWFPVEFHSVLPLVHWLPARWFRAILRALGHPELAQEEHLNLLGPSEVRELCLRADPAAAPVLEMPRLFGWPSNIVCVMRRG
jgi:putative flippase GtrA/ubiquinone/menaquinone biosynthesis C-methylase UbiE